MNKGTIQDDMLFIPYNPGLGENLKETRLQRERRKLGEARKGLRDAVYTALAIEKIIKWIINIISQSKKK